jgi:outer membrane protein OmpA-like peptidoglycan-associated protein
MFGRVGFALVLGAAALGSGACVATRDWVRDDIREADKPIQAKLAQLEASMAQEKARVDGRLAQLDGRVGQVDGRVTQVEGRVGQVAAQVTEARRVADEGVQKAGAVDARLTQALANRYKRELVSTVSMFFAPGKSQLLPLHRDALNGVLKVLADNPTYTADVVGYTDGEGPRGYNLTLSWLREEAARRYLAERGQVLNRLSFIGVGEDLTRGDRNHPMARARDRQVAILIFRPGQ